MTLILVAVIIGAGAPLVIDLWALTRWRRDDTDRKFAGHLTTSPRPRHHDVPMINYRRMYRALVAGAVLLSPGHLPAQGASRSDSSADVRAIVAARARSNAAIVRHDTAGIAREMMPDVTVVSSTSAMETGAAANVSGMAAQFARRPDTRWVRTPDTVTVFDAWGVASEHGQWVGTWTEPDGPLVIRGSYLAQWRRVGGTWRIQAELFVPLRCEGGAYCREHP